ncbi:DUF87 domain-containing protein [Pannus brasiliensis CCIBt3594]|uniref:DUF87 domain-containing protein n=1 Tax=Pannus brasiliensis CCIBt3594 TaxID=1427578 RepID=A0AAW9QX67_9CHRO
MFGKSRPLPASRMTAAPKPAIDRSRPGGILLGDNHYWNPETLANPHGAIVGASGSGKTQTLKAIALDASRVYNCKLIIIDFHGDQYLPGETRYELHASSDHGINPLTIDLSTTGGGPKLQAIAVADSFTRSLRLGPNQNGLMIDLLIECYRGEGIEDDPATWTREPPTLANLEELLKKRITTGCKESPKLSLKLRATFEYGIFSRNQPDIFSPDIVRIDLSELSKVPGLQAIAAETVCKQAIDRHRLLGESNSKIPSRIIFIDECKELKGQRTPDRIVADGRKYGLGLWIASQRTEHLSAEILSNTQTKIVLPVDAIDVAATAKKFRFHDLQIANLETLNALVRTGSEAFKVKIEPYYKRL